MTMNMLGLTLTQPWASLMALGEKSFETRSWRTNYRGWVAIHAAKGFPNEAQRVCRQKTVLDALHGLDVDTLPLGKIIAVGRLVECVSTAYMSVSEQERAFGDYSWGRFAFAFEDIRALAKPIPCKGALRFWDIPAGVAELLNKAIENGACKCLSMLL